MKPIHEVADLETPLSMSPEEFVEVGHKLVDRIAEFLNGIRQKPVTTNGQPAEIRSILGEKNLPVKGTTPGEIIDEATELLMNHSLLNGHPRFWGYITSSASPIGALGDLLASAVNPNVGAHILSPMATEIERQTIQWMSEFIGFPSNSSGLLVSGGNVANFIGFLAARRAKADWDVRKLGLYPKPAKDVPTKQLLIYCSKGTHTWIEKAADIFGLGTGAIRWIDMNGDQQMDTEKLDAQIVSDLSRGLTPFLVVGTAGSVSTGAVDSLLDIAKICKSYNLWFHVDGAYGAPAAVLPEYADVFKGLDQADSVAFDPHKWLFSPLEAGCILVKGTHHLTDAFSFHPEYYNFEGRGEEPLINYYDYGLQNSRGFRALKVWMGIKHAGLEGYQKMIRDNIGLAKDLYHMVSENEELEPITHNLSITTFRYIPKELRGNLKAEEDYLNLLNEELLNNLQGGGKVFLSNAVVEGKYSLRVCIVNFRTRHQDLEALLEIVLKEGKLLHEKLRSRPQ